MKKSVTDTTDRTLRRRELASLPAQSPGTDLPRASGAAAARPAARPGLLHLNITHLWFGPTSDLRLTAYTPVDTVTETRLAQLRKLVAKRAA
jgi:hypothetical protein